MSEFYEDHEMTEEELEAATAPDAENVTEATDISTEDNTDVNEKTGEGDGFIKDPLSGRMMKKPQNLNRKNAKTYDEMMKELQKEVTKARSIKLPELWDRALRLKALNEGRTEKDVLESIIVSGLESYHEFAYRMALNSKGLNLD